MKEKLALAHNTVLQLRPEKGNQKNAQQYLSLAKTYLECGMPQLGLKCLQNAKEFMLCAELCERMGKFQEAVNWYSKAQCFDKVAHVVERNPSASALSVENWRLRAAAAHLHADRESDALNSLSSLPPETQIRFLKSYKRFGPAGNLLIKMGRRNEAAALFRDNGQLAQAAEAAEPKSQMAAECLLGDVRVHMHLALAHSEDVDQPFRLLLMRVESGLVDICKEVHVPLIQAEAHFLLGQLQSDAEELKLAYHLFDKLGHIMGKVEALAAFLDCGQGGPDCVAWLLDALEGLLNVIVAFCSKFGGSQLTDAQTQDINHCHVFYGIHEEPNEYRILKYEGSRFQKLWFDLNDGSTNHFAASKVSLQKAREILQAHMLKLLKYLVYKVRDFSQQNSIEICPSLILGLACQQEGCKKLHRQISKHDINELVITKINDIHLLGILLKAEAELKSDDLVAVTNLMPKQKFEACEGLLSLLFPKHFHLRHLSENRKGFSSLLGRIRNGSYFAPVITKYMKDCVEQCSARERRESSDMWIKVFCASKLLSKTKEHLELLHQEEEHFIAMKNKTKSDILPGKKGMIMNTGHCICFFRLFVDSMSYFQNRELADSMHYFYRFLKLIKDRQSFNHSLLPSMGNLVMLLEFQFLLTFALFMRVKHQVICLPRSYLTILNLWELLVNVNLTNRKNAINTYAAKKGVESRLTNHLKFLVDSLSSCLPRTFSKECLMSGEMERAVVLCLVVLVNSGIVSKIDIPIRLYLSELKVKLESLFADVPSRLMACVGAVNSAKRPIDVVNILEGLLKQRDDEFVQDFSWENSHYGQNSIIFQRVYHKRFGERAFSPLENLNEETSFQEQKMADEHEYFENTVEEVIVQRQRNQKRKEATQIRWRKAFRKVMLCLRMLSPLRVAARNTSFIPAVVNNKRCEICGVVFRKYVTAEEEEQQQQQTEDEPDVSEESDMPEHEDATTTKGHCNLENHMQRVIEYSDYRAFFQHSVDPVLWQAKEVKKNLKLATLDPLQQERKKLSELEKDITDTAEFIRQTMNWQAGKDLLLSKAKELENFLQHVNGMLSKEMPSTVALEPEEIEDDHATFEEIQPQTYRNKKCRKYRQRGKRR
uniref:Uncharacterized protein n=1 Tax=Eptatretus burgeri TaxID=7764 RepID=A0A8C4N9F6_EPTBU